jgi:hypothetical protein
VHIGDVAVHDLRVGEVRDTVRAHAFRECEQLVLLHHGALAGERVSARGEVAQARYAARTVGKRSSIDEGTWILPSVPGSGKVGTPWLRMQAENACGPCGRGWFALVVPTCATFAPVEPPHAEAAKVNPVTPTSASARDARALAATTALAPVVRNARFQQDYTACIGERS